MDRVTGPRRARCSGIRSFRQLLDRNSHSLQVPTDHDEPLPLFQRFASVSDAAREQIFLAVEMGVERRPTDVGSVDDVLYRQRFTPLLLN